MQGLSPVVLEQCLVRGVCGIETKSVKTKKNIIKKQNDF